MASSDAWNWGANIGNRIMEEKSAHKQAMSDAQFQKKHNELQGMVENLNNRLAAVPEEARNTPDYLKLKDQLAQTLQSRDEHWKSLDHPNAIMKLGKMLGKDLRFKKQAAPIPVAPPVYGQSTMDVNGEKVPTGPAYKVQGPQTPAQMRAAAEASQLVAAAPLSPEQQGTQTGQKQAAEDLALFNSKLKLYDQNHPEGVGANATPEGKQARNEYVNNLLTSGLKELKEPIETWTDVKGAVPQEYPKGSGKYRIEQTNKKGEKRWNDEPEGYTPPAPKPGKLTGIQLLQDSYLATIGLPYGTAWDTLSNAQRSGFELYKNELARRSANHQWAVTDRDGNVHVIDLSSSSGPVEVGSPSSSAPSASGGVNTPKPKTQVGAGNKPTKQDIVLNIKKATPDYTKAKNLYNDANRIAIQGDGWLKHHSSEADQNFVLSLIKSEAGRVNQQEIAMMFDAGGITEGPERWAAKIGHGELPQELRKQIVDFTHASRDAAKQVLDEMNAGSTPNTGGSTPDAASKSLADRLQEARGVK